MEFQARPQDLLLAYDPDFTGYTSLSEMAQPLERASDLATSAASLGTALAGVPVGVLGGTADPDGYYEDFTARLDRFVRDHPRVGGAAATEARALDWKAVVVTLDGYGGDGDGGDGGDGDYGDYGDDYGDYGGGYGGGGYAGRHGGCGAEGGCDCGCGGSGDAPDGYVGGCDCGCGGSGAAPDGYVGGCAGGCVCGCGDGGYGDYGDEDESEDGDGRGDSAAGGRALAAKTGGAPELVSLSDFIVGVGVGGGVPPPGSAEADGAASPGEMDESDLEGPTYGSEKTGGWDPPGGSILDFVASA